MGHERAAGGDTEAVLSARYSGTPQGVREALAEVASGLRGLNAGDEEVFSAELVLAEALNNVVEHALAEVDDATFSVEMRRGARGVFFEVSDPGKPMPDGETPIGEAPIVASATGDLPEGGFGWFLIRELARDLTYRRDGARNMLNYRLAICMAEVV